MAAGWSSDDDPDGLRVFPGLLLLLPQEVLDALRDGVETREDGVVEGAAVHQANVRQHRPRLGRVIQTCSLWRVTSVQLTPLVSLLHDLVTD